MKNSNASIIQNLTCDIPAYSAVPQTTLPPRAPYKLIGLEFVLLYFLQCAAHEIIAVI